MIEAVIEQHRKSLGGFEVGRVLPSLHRHMVGPFIFFDHMGPADFAPGLPRSVDVRPHPHIGLSTVTYLFEGEIMHRDSLATVQPIRAGEVNWMTAGRGITHSERFERARRQGDRLHGIQSWVALPEAEEECDPAFAHYGSADLPVLEAPGLQARVVAGQAYGLQARVKLHSPMFYVHCNMAAGAVAEVPTGYPERAVYIAAGAIEAEGQAYGQGKLLLLAAGGGLALKAASASIVMLLGGEPLGRRYIEWNFVSASRSRIEQAKADWRAGRMKLPDFDADEFIPLPEEHPKK